MIFYGKRDRIGKNKQKTGVFGCEIRIQAVKYLANYFKNLSLAMPTLIPFMTAC